MNPNWENVEDLLDLASNLWIGLVVILAAVVPSWLAAKNHIGIKKVQDQVVNGHKTPMREDLDSVRETLQNMGEHIRQDMHLIKTELSDIRSDLSIERNERINLDHRFEQHRKGKGRQGDS